jgi:hypothetical protein
LAGGCRLVGPIPRALASPTGPQPPVAERTRASRFRAARCGSVRFPAARPWPAPSAAGAERTRASRFRSRRCGFVRPAGPVERPDGRTNPTVPRRANPTAAAVGTGLAAAKSDRVVKERSLIIVSQTFRVLPISGEARTYRPADETTAIPKSESTASGRLGEDGPHGGPHENSNLARPRRPGNRPFEMPRARSGRAGPRLRDRGGGSRPLSSS